MNEQRTEERAAERARAVLGWAGDLPAGVWAAPRRRNLIGEHTDYNDGFVLPFAIDRAAFVAARPRDDGRLRLWSRQLGQSEIALADVAPRALEGWVSYVAGAVWAAREAGAAVQGLDVLLDSDVPLGAGLSSSAAIICSTLLATADLFGLAGDRVALAQLARRAEVEIAGVPVGVMDQIASMCAERERALLLDCRTMSLTPIPFELEPAGLSTLVIDTRAPHQLAAGQYAARRAACQRAAQALHVPALRDVNASALEAARSQLDLETFRRARHVVSENARVLAAVAALGARDFAALGRLISASHASLRDDFEVSVPQLDVAAEAAERAGALGARMVGGGFGGSVLALLPRERVADCEREVATAFAQRGFDAPVCFTATPSRGARRLL
ncbi:MAG: galactokinase [Polyangiaceae bacterium]